MRSLRTRVYCTVLIRMARIFTRGSPGGIQNGRPERAEQGLGVHRLEYTHQRKRCDKSGGWAHFSPTLNLNSNFPGPRAERKVLFLLHRTGARSHDWKDSQFDKSCDVGLFFRSPTSHDLSMGTLRGSAAKNTTFHFMAGLLAVRYPSHQL